LSDFAGDTEWLEIDEHHVAVGAAGDDAETFCGEGFGEGRGVLFDLCGVGFELGL